MKILRRLIYYTDGGRSLGWATQWPYSRSFSVAYLLSHSWKSNCLRSTGIIQMWAQSWTQLREESEHQR